VQQLGIDSITGQIIADDRIFPDYSVPSTWIWGDMGNYYGAGACGLSIYDNLFEVAFKSGPAPGDPTKVKHIVPEIPGMVLNNSVVAADIDYDDAYLFGAPHQMERCATGRIPRGQNNFVVKGSIPDPALLAAQQWHTQLRQKGIGIAQAPTTARLLQPSTSLAVDTMMVLKSPLFKDLVKETNMRSLNLFCEHFLLHLCLANDEAPSYSTGSRLLTEFWQQKDIYTKGMYLNDGSGLSRFNAISARQLAGVMQQVYAGEQQEVFFASLPVAGVSGSLRGLCSGTAAEGNLRAKSGYMTRVRSYTGVVTSKSGRPIAFAMVANNYTCSAYQMKLKFQRLMIALAQVE
ncbi:MAG: D-alanyl-D-alanine carboxypeptidase/D-alanyl-D-alanine-endopeptidase, partial [Salibacteraceae bacterium]